MMGPRVSQLEGPLVQQAPAPYAPYQTGGTDWTTTITALFGAIMPLIVVMMLFKMMGPMLSGMTSK